jgi:nitrate reductase beta subunit
VVLIDQNRCRAWRMCISACPYKKSYYNWRTGKMEKCLLCYPRLEVGEAPACFRACPGRIRYLGPILYDLDRVAKAANVPDDQLVDAQREIILDPNDPEVIDAARPAGISDAWLDACRRSPVFKMVKEWRIALPLHPEFRTLPSLFYVPPESPVRTAVPEDGTTIGMAKSRGVLPDLDQFRIPIRFLAGLFGAGNEAPVRIALQRQLAVRAFRRSERVDGTPDTAVLEAAGLTVSQARAMHRLLALAHHHERFVIPTTRRERTANAPYIERGFTGFTELAPGNAPKRRSFFHGAKPGVEVGP